MSSHDKRWSIERFPEYDENGKIISVSYGCMDLNLMGYKSISSLCLQMTYVIDEIRVNEIIEIAEKTGKESKNE